MRSFRDAKAMAKTLRDAMQLRQVTLSHSESLELVAAQLGLGNWNILAAKIAGGPARTPEGPSFDPAVPILRIFAVDKAKEFYLDFLGFSLDWEHRFEASLPLYAQVSRSRVALHLSEHHGDASPGSTVFVAMRGVEALRQELVGRQYPYARPGIEDMRWGRVLEVTDPFGNRLRFCEQKREA
ncbi:MAG: VOC family protein [Proteobacteria bacterium]|nr:VOC family protein [Pseudomonadota bacterium]